MTSASSTPASRRSTRATFANSNRRALFRGREPAELEEYVTDQFAREAVSFIDRHRAEPFFLYLAFNAPHAPLEATDVYYQRFPQFTDERKRVYAAMISALDDGVGRVLAKLREAGIEERTLVVFVSDNGAAEYADADGKRNAPFSGHKRNLYEGGIRLPYILRWPDRLPAGKIYAPMVSTLDLMPTLLAAAGGNAGSAVDGGPPLDGVDLAPFLTGEREGPPHQALYWRTGFNGAIRQGDWKLLIAREDGTGKEIVRLYDLAHDAGEQHDLAGKKPGGGRGAARRMGEVERGARWRRASRRAPSSHDTREIRSDGEI